MSIRFGPVADVGMAAAVASERAVRPHAWIPPSPLPRRRAAKPPTALSPFNHCRWRRPPVAAFVTALQRAAGQNSGYQRPAALAGTAAAELDAPDADAGEGGLGRVLPAVHWPRPDAPGLPASGGNHEFQERLASSC